MVANWIKGALKKKWRNGTDFSFEELWIVILFTDSEDSTKRGNSRGVDECYSFWDSDFVEFPEYESSDCILGC